MNVKFLSIAAEELTEAYEYYEEQSQGLGSFFIQAVEKKIAIMKEHPYSCPEVMLGIYRCLVKRFPYSIVFQITEETIEIIAIANLYREPNYWTKKYR